MGTAGVWVASNQSSSKVPRILVLEVGYQAKGIGHLRLCKTVQLLPSLTSSDNSIESMALANVKVGAEYNSLGRLW